MRASVDHTHADPMPSARSFVEQDARRAAVVDHHEIAVAVVVDVAHGKPAADFQPIERGTCLRGDIDERSTTVVAKQKLGLLERIPLAALQLTRQMSDGSVDHDEIQQAVVVDVDEAGAKACETELEHTHFHGAIFVQAFAGVEVHRVRLVVEIRHEEILVAVPVDIPDIDTHAALRYPGPVERNTGQPPLLDEAPPDAVDAK